MIQRAYILYAIYIEKNNLIYCGIFQIVAMVMCAFAYVKYLLFAVCSHNIDSSLYDSLCVFYFIFRQIVIFLYEKRKSFFFIYSS